ncbi:MAG: saccharopine dehydrogenase NADP-binding domain-containing protein [Acidobacteria bacterium]|nr:saccharopine dehydrogenase NADP-binding domain-containing protein [Acidobacteriota bacterium]
MQNRDFDVVLYGASGFTGKQTVEYFARNLKPGELRWAIAGRNRQKLEAVKAEIGGAAKDLEILVADSDDQAAVDAMVSHTRVMLTTAGPYALYGTPIVDACVRFKTHYVDITGETPWVKDLITRYHDQAAADGTRIIPFCGFDSVPSDLGAFLVARYIQNQLGAQCVEVKAYFQLNGGLNGGTMATVFNLIDAGETERARDVFLLNPPGEHSEQEIARNQDPKIPQYNTDIAAWAGPFFMSQINTRVVRRSSALYEQWHEPYGPNFFYQEHMKFGGLLGGIQAAGMSAGAAMFNVALQTPLREFMKPLLPKPGDGPSEKTMNEGWFLCDLVGVTSDGRKVKGVIRDQGDPGNRATVKFVCESALSLALNFDQLPGGPERGGVLTPATALGEVLAERLRNVGMVIEIG